MPTSLAADRSPPASSDLIRSAKRVNLSLAQLEETLRAVDVPVVLRREKLNPSEVQVQLRGMAAHIDSLNRLLKGPSRTAGRPRQAAATRAPKLNSLVSAGALLASTDFIERMHFTKQALSKAISANRMFYVDVKGERRFPAFFAESRYDRKQLERVCQLLGDLPGAAKWQFFVSPKASLGNATPLDALAKGGYAQVRVAAEGFAER